MFICEFRIQLSIPQNKSKLSDALYTTRDVKIQRVMQRILTQMTIRQISHRNHLVSLRLSQWDGKGIRTRRFPDMDWLCSVRREELKEVSVSTPSPTDRTLIGLIYSGESG